MSFSIRSAGILCLLAAVGCGGSESTVPFTDNSQDSDAYALTVKQAVSDQVTVAAKSSEPGDQITTLVSMLELPGNRPQGPHEPIYLEILAAAQKLTQECAAANGKPPGLAASLKDLKAIGDKLPGEVTKIQPGQD